MEITWIAPFPYVRDNTMHTAPWISELALLLTKNGELKINIVSPIPGLDRVEVLAFTPSITIYYVPVVKNALDLLSLYQIRIIQLKKILFTENMVKDIIHLHGTEHQYFSSISAYKKKCIISMQGIMRECSSTLKQLRFYFPKYHNYLRNIASWSLSSFYETNEVKKNKTFTARTHFDTSYIKEINPTADITCIWEVIREEFFKERFSYNKKYLLFVGGTHPLKGIDRVLSAFSVLKKERKSSSLKLSIAGFINPLVFKNLLIKLNISKIVENDIEFLGYLDTLGLVSAFSKSYVLLHPSYIDNSPNTVCEAQVAGLPVIATNVGGLSSIIQNRYDGILVDNSVENLVNSIRELLDDDHLVNSIRINAISTARKRHDRSIIKDSYLNLYHNLYRNI
ncbi:MAG: glycosyltransferase family 4 protein [Ignavibacteriaceae bacterium]|nr:glycosyltransferase family 4 protein [Ignavibacteriaceae bacterium]